MLGVRWVIKFSKLSLVKRKSVGEGLTLVEADDLSFIVDLVGEGKLRAGEIKRGKDAVLDHETMDRRIDYRGSIVAYNYAIPVDSGYVCLSGTRKSEDVKGPVVQQVALCYFVVGSHIADYIALVINVGRVITFGIGHNNQVKSAVANNVTSNISGPCEKRTAHDLSVAIDGGCSAERRAGESE